MELSPAMQKEHCSPPACAPALHGQISSAVSAFSSLRSSRVQHRASTVLLLLHCCIHFSPAPNSSSSSSHPALLLAVPRSSTLRNISIKYSYLLLHAARVAHRPAACAVVQRCPCSAAALLAAPRPARLAAGLALLQKIGNKNGSVVDSHEANRCAAADRSMTAGEARNA